MSLTVRHINTGVTVSSNLQFNMFVCGRIDSIEFGCGTQLAHCTNEERELQGMYLVMNL